MRAAEGKSFAGVSPYPGFANLDSTCWNNSVLQCLFHCHAVRDALAGKERGPTQSCATQLAQLLRVFVDGVPVPELPVAHAKMDIIAPHDFVDFVESTSKRFIVGQQHDAADFLSWLLEKSELHHACCDVGPGCRNANGIVLLEEFAMQSTQADICRAGCIDMQNLLRSSLQHDATRLRHLPSVLVLRVPQILCEDDIPEHEWIQPIENPDDVPVSWGDEFFDFSDCCTDGCENTHEAVYRIKAYVQYCRRPPMPSFAVSSRHYVAFFIEDTIWYHCDDLLESARPVRRCSPPTEFPYICFFEKVGQAKRSPAHLPANPVKFGNPRNMAYTNTTNQEDEDASGDRSESTDASGCADPSPFLKRCAVSGSSMENPAAAPGRKRFKASDYPSCSNSYRIHPELADSGRRSSDSANEQDAHAESDCPSDLAINEQRQIAQQRHILDEPVPRNNDHGDDDDGQARLEANEERALLGLADLSRNTRIQHRFDDETLTRITQFQMRERYTPLTKELRLLPFMRHGLLPTSNDLADTERNRQIMRNEVLDKFGGDLSRERRGLAFLMADQIKDFVVEQRKAFESTASTGTTEDHSDDDVIPDGGMTARATVDPKAYFLNGGRWRRPSDYIAHLAAEFEAGNTTSPDREKKKKKLARDQVIFLIGFANACNNVWEQECNDTPMENRTEYAFLLMGQAGSGKTTVVQEIVLPAVDFIFPPEQRTGSSSIVVCASWAQAQTMSTTPHKAVSCHNATFMRVQSYRNKDMLPKISQAALEARLNPKRALIIEEVSMIPPSIYNMLLYRFYHGRKKRWQVTQERLYTQPKCAFGRMPLKLHVGDFLQIRPTGAMSLLTDMDALTDKTEDKQIPPEYQNAAKLFLATEHCYELTGANRFRDDEGGRQLKELVEFMRDPKPESSDAYRRVADLWQTILVREEGGQIDERLRQPRFQRGHMLALFSETCGPWMTMRARHDARALLTPLFCLQAADRSSPPMQIQDAARLLNHYNPHETGGIHGMFLLHLGMRIRLTDTLCKEKGLIKDAEGTVVRIVVHPRDADMVASAFRDAGTGDDARAYLTEMPLGIWLRMDKYDGAPHIDHLAQSANLTGEEMQSLLFLEPQSSFVPFVWREFKISRCGFPLTHAMVRTSTACRGKTCEQGVVIDCAKRESRWRPTNQEEYWMHMYVMLSQATSLVDILLLRAPDARFLLQGPPRKLKERLEVFRARVATCYENALALAGQLGFDGFL